MKQEDFCDFEDCSSTYKLQNSLPRAYLADKVIFRRGNHVMYYKTDFTNVQEYTLNFLRIKNIKRGIPAPKQKTEYKGITQERKTAIVQKLTPFLMPDNRRVFWYDLPTNVLISPAGLP